MFPVETTEKREHWFSKKKVIEVNDPLAEKERELLTTAIDEKIKKPNESVYPMNEAIVASVGADKNDVDGLYQKLIDTNLATPNNEIASVINGAWQDEGFQKRYYECLVNKAGVKSADEFKKQYTAVADNISAAAATENEQVINYGSPKDYVVHVLPNDEEKADKATKKAKKIKTSKTAIKAAVTAEEIEKAKGGTLTQTSDSEKQSTMSTAYPPMWQKTSMVGDFVDAVKETAGKVVETISKYEEKIAAKAKTEETPAKIEKSDFDDEPIPFAAMEPAELNELAKSDQIYQMSSDAFEELKDILSRNGATQKEIKKLTERKQNYDKKTFGLDDSSKQM
jgi:hypothetical protein